MKVFISSVITDMEGFRAAAKEAVMQLGHEAIMAEDFGARPHSPQIACLEGLRQSGLVVLILGNSYGAKQPSGLSATHEEYHEAKRGHPILAFVSEKGTFDEDQRNLVKEVQAWEGGLFREAFDTPDQLKKKITRAIHEWQVSTAIAPLNADELRQAAINAVVEEQKKHSAKSSLIFSIIGGPVQSILRPSEIEKPELADYLLQGALFGENKIFSTGTGNKSTIERDSLILQQEDGARLIKVDPQGSIVLRLILIQGRSGFVVIREQLERQLMSAIKYGAWILDKIDPTQRLTHVSMASAFSEGNHMLIRTREEDDASPNSFTLGVNFGNRKNQPIFLKPAHRARAALVHDAKSLAEDFITLLKRDLSTGRY